MKNTNLLMAFAWVAFLEGVSYVLLLLAMLMKYDIVGNVETGKMLVANLGMAHGLLTVLYVLLLVQCKVSYSWGMGKTVLYFVLSLIPFGSFWVDKELLAEKRALQAV